jgi:EAL domain-containing protein (putative c-di-GMP-specific phosphodiesterase class I)
MPRSTAPQPVLLSALSEATIRNIDKVLRAVRTYMGMDVAFVSEFMGTNRIFRNVDAVAGGPIRGGGVVPLAVGYCRRVIDGELPELIPNTMAVAAARVLPETHSIPIGAHLCVPIRINDGQLYGTFCSFSYVANPSLNERDLQMMKTFAELIAREIEQETRVVRERETKLKRLNDAIQRGDPQIVYQPICRLRDGQITGVEALARFASDPETPPNLWFADAEEAGIGTELELLAIRKAVAAAAALPSDMELNLNTSALTVCSSGFGSALESFAPENVVIEITEQGELKDYGRLLEALAPLRARGVRVAVDGAGAGYANMSHMLSLKPDLIKLDISLTRGIGSDPTRSALAGALVEFARLTGASVVAEGIENAGELAALRRLGIERGQGYYLSRPLGMDVFLELLDRSGRQMANLTPIALAVGA